MVQHLISLLTRLNSHSVCVFEICQMMLFTDSLSSQIDGMMSIGLLANAWSSLINYPRFISIPNGPCPVSHTKSFLEALPQSPFGRTVLYNKLIVLFSQLNVTKWKYCLFLFISPDFDKILCINLHMGIALVEEGVDSLAHFGFGFRARIGIKGRGLLKLPLRSKTQAQYIFSFTADSEVVLSDTACWWDIDLIDLLKYFVGKGVSFETRLSCSFD